MTNVARILVAIASLATLLLVSPTVGSSTPVATSDELYQVCGRVFSDPHAFWPSPAQAPARSPFAKGNAACAAQDFLQYDEMVSGMEYLERLFPRFVEFYELERDFGDGSDCTSSTSNADLCSAGLPQVGPNGPTRERVDLYMVRVTDEAVADTNKKFFVFPLSIHGIERAGAEAGVRASEDLATWAACEAGVAPAITKCAQEGAIPHPLLETQPGRSIGAGDALRRSSIWFVFANPDGWRRGDTQNGVRFFQRYNGNGVDMNRDWPTMGFTFRPFTPWSEPETRSFGKVLKSIRPTWDGGIDLHGQLADDAFSFTMMGASERDYSKDQRILQTVKGAWEDAEGRLAWSAAIKPNDASKDDPRMYGVQWGTVWDTIGYTTTGSFGDWIDSPLGLGADGIDNEMSFSHITNCGVGSCYLTDFEQLHIDGNKSLIYAMVNFTHLPEDTTFRVPGKVAYVFNPKVLRNSGQVTSPPPGAGLPAQQPYLDARLDATNDFQFQFDVHGIAEGVYNGGLTGTATTMNAGGVGGTEDPSGLTSSNVVLERYRAGEETPQATACASEDAWEEVNRNFIQGGVYIPAGASVVTNMPIPGEYRICVRGGLVSKLRGSGGYMDLDVTFAGEQAWEDPGQLPYSATNMKFFTDLAKNMPPGQLVSVSVDDVLSGAVKLDSFDSVVVADDPLPGYVEPTRTGPAQGEIVFADAPAKTAATVPCAYQPGLQDVLPPTCAADFEFDVHSGDFNNQQMTVTLTAEHGVDWDLYIERQSRINGEWFPVTAGATSSASESATVYTPPAGHYRARVVNWASAGPVDQLKVTFSNVYVGPELPPSSRTTAERDAWGAKLRTYTERGGNLVLTDGAVRNLAYMGAVGRGFVNNFSVYAGYIGFTRDGSTSTYGHALGRDVNQPGAAEGPQFRHQTYEPVPIGYAISPPDEDTNLSSSPVWTVDQIEWERLGGTTVGITTADQVSLGELRLGKGVVRTIGALLPMPTEEYYHPFGLANYALTYTGYQVLKNALQWQRPLPDLAIAPADIAFPSSKVRGGDRVTITATVRNIGLVPAEDVAVRFTHNGAALGTATIASIDAGGSGTASVVWDTKHLKGEHTIAVAVDPANAIAESDEGNNTASRVVTVQGNKVQNASFEQSSSGSSPDSWESSGATSYESGGSDGARSVAAGPGGAWTSAPIEVTAGQAYTVSVDTAGAAGTLAVQQLSPTGAVVASIAQPLSAAGVAFQPVEIGFTPVAGVASVRVVLAGGLTGVASFDNVGLWGDV